MKPSASDHDEIKPGEGSPEPGYEAWKRAKVERGLAESRDRTIMIPVEQVWRDLNLEG